MSGDWTLYDIFEDAAWYLKRDLIDLLESQLSSMGVEAEEANIAEFIDSDDELTGWFIKRGGPTIRELAERFVEEGWDEF